MSVSRANRRAFILSCCLMFAACTGSVKFTFVNNTSSSLQIFSGEGAQFELQSGASLQKKIWYGQSFPIIIRGEQDFFYKFPSPSFVPGKFYKLGLVHGVKLQIEESMQIYLLLPDQEGPTQNLPGQPAGFPLIPTQ